MSAGAASTTGNRVGCGCFNQGVEQLGSTSSTGRTCQESSIQEGPVPQGVGLAAAAAAATAAAATPTAAAMRPRPAAATAGKCS
jgi:hypothetical protein